MKQQILIREAQPDDAKRIYEINMSSLGYDFPQNRTKERLESILAKGTDKIIVAEYEGDVVGYVHGSDYECTYCESLKNILALAVDGKFQGRGIGILLLKKIEEWAASDRCSGVRLVSSMNRTNAHEFYIHCGYSHRKDQKNFIKYFGK